MKKFDKKMALYQGIERKYFNSTVKLPKLGMTQREFASLVGKPQSTIARIESGKMNVSINVLTEIAIATNQKLTVDFTPITA